MAIIRFPYQKIRGHWEPIIPLRVKLGSFWRPLNFYVDSGATYMVLRAALVEETGFDYRQGERVYLQVGNGGLLCVYLTPLELQLGTERFICPVGISPQFLRFALYKIGNRTSLSASLITSSLTP